MNEPKTSTQLPKQSVELIRATLEDMRKNGLVGGLPQEHAFTLLEEIDQLRRQVRTLERTCQRYAEAMEEDGDV